MEKLAGLQVFAFIWFVVGTLLMPLYGGEPVGEGIPEPKIVEIPLNMLFFYSMFLLQSCILFLSRSQPNNKA